MKNDRQFDHLWEQVMCNPQNWVGYGGDVGWREGEDSEDKCSEVVEDAANDQDH